MGHWTRPPAPIRSLYCLALGRRERKWGTGVSRDRVTQDMEVWSSERDVSEMEACDSACASYAPPPGAPLPPPPPHCLTSDVPLTAHRSPPHTYPHVAAPSSIPRIS